MWEPEADLGKIWWDLAMADGEWWWWGNNLITGPRKPGREGTCGLCKIVASGEEILFIDWWTIICNIGQPTSLTRERIITEAPLSSSAQYRYQAAVLCCFESPASPVSCCGAKMMNGVTLMLWRYQRYLRSTSTLEPGKLPHTPLGIFHILYFVLTSQLKVSPSVW